MEQMRLRYPGVCRECHAPLPARAEAFYDRTTKTVLCLSHHLGPTAVETHPPEVPAPVAESDVEVGEAGASARREFDRRRQSREDRIRAKHPKVGGLILALSDDPQSTRTWDTGALGEERLGARLNELATPTLRVLHDRRIPRTRANIDHIAVTPAGAWVIDAKRYKGRPELRVEGGILRARVEKLTVGGRDQTKLVDGMLRQVELVAGIVGESVPVQGVLCFIEADWPLIGGSFTTRDIRVMWPKKLYPLLHADGDLEAGTIADVHRQLADAFPPA